MAQTHQLAAIMFTDIVGYTSLMGENEKKAFDLLNKNRQIQKPVIQKFNGRWLKEMGDGILASFNSASDAVYCATEIQELCSREADLKLRIGIHIGEVVFEESDVFGDGVNIASRLQALAPIGSTWISESVFNNICNKADIVADFVKAQTLKNVKEPVRIYQVRLRDNAIPELNKGGVPKNLNSAILLLGIVILASIGYLVYSSFKGEIQSAKDKESVAVLYFENMSGDPEQEYFSDGITEEIITHLSKIKDLRVISRTSVFPYKGRPVNLKKIGDELNVSSILEGSVRKSGNTLRITAQLIDSDSDEHIWVQTFDVGLRDVFEVQSQIARAIAKKLEVDINPDTESIISEIPTSSLEAHDQYQKGMFFLYKKYLNQNRQEYFMQSKRYFERAIELDSGYSEAYAGLAELYDELRNKDPGKFPDSLLALKVKLARKALFLNPSSSFANTAMVWALINHPDPKPDSGYFYAKRAFELAPSDALTNHNLSQILTKHFGLHEVALPLTKRAVKADPFDPNLHVSLGVQYSLLGKYSEAKKAFQDCLNLTNEPFREEDLLIIWLIYLDNFDQVDKMVKIRGEANPYIRSYLYAAKGDIEKIDPAYRNDPFILLVMNPNRVVKEVIQFFDKEIEKGWNAYDILRNSKYLKIYREHPDFKELVVKAKKNRDKYLAKYGDISIPE